MTSARAFSPQPHATTFATLGYCQWGSCASVCLYVCVYVIVWESAYLNVKDFYVCQYGFRALFCFEIALDLFPSHHAMDLRNHLASLKRELQKSSHQIRCAEKAKRRRGARIDEQGGNHFVRLLVLAVYLLSGSSLELAVNCWMRRRRQSHCAEEDMSTARGEHLVRLWVDEVDDEFWEALRSRNTAECRKAREEANKFLSNAHAAVWALQNNVNKGHAPTTQQLWDEKERAAEVLHQGDGERSAPSATQNAMKMWGNNGGYYGTSNMESCEDETATTLKNCAPRWDRWYSKRCIFGIKSGPNIVTKKR